MYFTADTKATPVSVQGAGVNYRIHMEFGSPQCCENVFEIDMRDSVVFGSKSGYVFRKDWVSLG
jgi:hypothetical protein